MAFLLLFLRTGLAGSGDVNVGSGGWWGLVRGNASCTPFCQCVSYVVAADVRVARDPHQRDWGELPQVCERLLDNGDKCLVCADP